MTLTREKVAGYLGKARAYIESKGLTQRKMVDKQTGAVCSMGGIHHVMGLPMDVDHPNAEPVARALAEAIGITEPCEACGSWYCEVTMWNDDRERTLQEVLDGFAKAEKIQRAGFDPDA